MTSPTDLAHELLVRTGDLLEQCLDGAAAQTMAPADRVVVLREAARVVAILASAADPAALGEAEARIDRLAVAATTNAAPAGPVANAKRFRATAA